LLIQSQLPQDYGIGRGREMDKFTNSVWFTRVVAFALAVLLFTSVNFESDANGSNGVTTPAENDNETIEDVPVEVYYDQENLVVTGVPETVNVTLKGPKSLLISAKNQREFKVIIDLSDPEITMGEKNVQLEIIDLNEKLTATIDPENITVNVQERVTKEFSVEVEYNRSLLADGYIAEAPEINPKRVEITGGKDVIEQISYVKATLELQDGLNANIEGEATVRALDRDLNKLDVTIEPDVVDVSLRVSIPEKTVKVVPVKTGTPPDEIKITSITAEQKEVTIYGSEEMLSKIDQVEVPVDVSNIDKDTELELPITVPAQVNNISRKDVSVLIKTATAASENEPVDTETQTETDPEAQTETDPEANTDNTETEEEPTDSQGEEASVQTKTFSNLRIDPVELAEDQEIEFLSPSKGVTSIILNGSADALSEVDESDVQLTINVANLQEGRHEVTIQVKAPSGIKYELADKNASITIAKINDET
jgi:YbbR domain-containing protein